MRVLHLEDVRKTYHAGSFTQAALDGVSITFRDNEFVAILGPSGSGKTTLLNIIGGLDHADSGDLAIDQISTSEYRDRDWDAYRNNRIGFVFQSYNLIPHQSVLANVELALTLSGVGKAERVRRARAALEEVGLGDHVHKLPNQLSGGQMQRVAIARALVNDPEIVLADEPTGALDSVTGVQVMGLLTEIAKDRLVVMVTHNPELAEECATRIVSLKDGRVVADTDPYSPGDQQRDARPSRRTSMGFLTAIALSFTNLMTKKGRTLMTSFAGSIGIIGIATILALANGVNAYINEVEQDTLSLYPLTIQTQGIDLSAMLASGAGAPGSTPSPRTDGEAHEVSQLARMFSRIGTNDLKSLKTFLDSPESGIGAWVNAIDYRYNVTPQIYDPDTTERVRKVNPNPVFASLGMTSESSSMMSNFSMGMTSNAFAPLPQDLKLLDGQYDLRAGKWPDAADECVLVLTGSGGVSDYLLYTMGLRDPDELDQMVKDLAAGNPIHVPTHPDTGFSYAELMSVRFTVVPAEAFYEYDQARDVWTDRSGDSAWMTDAIAHGEPLRIVGVVAPDPSATATMLTPGLYYTPALVSHLMAEAAAAPVVRQQLATPERNVFSGDLFADGAKSPSLGDFDFSSLINVDPSAMSSLLNFDPGKMNLDLSGMDLSSLGTSMPGLNLPPPDLMSLLGGLNVQVSPTGLSELVTLTLGDYLSEILGGVTGAPGSSPGGLPSGFPTSLPSGFPSSLPSGLLPSGLLPSGFPSSLPSGSSTAPTSLPEGLRTWLPTATAPDSQPASSPSGAGETIASGTTGLRAGPVGGLPMADPTTPEPSATPTETATSPATPDPEPTNSATTGPSTSTPAEPTDPATVAPTTAPISPGPTSVAPTTAPTSPSTGPALPIPTSPTGTPGVPGVPSVDDVVNSFANWFARADVQAKFLARLGAVIDLSALEQQLAGALSNYLQQTMQTVLSSMMKTLQTQLGVALQAAMGQVVGQLSSLSSGFDPDALGKMFSFNMDPAQLTTMLMSMASNQANSLDQNLRRLGYADPATPSSISMYPKDFAAKQHMLDILDGYNTRMADTDQDDKVITYTDLVGTLMSSVTDIIDRISAVLVAFVSISLVVSSIMIGVITYISVLERRKEIGILRAMGASKGNIGNVFNAETLIIGFTAGVMGVLITIGLTMIANPIIASLYDINDVAQLPVAPAVGLVGISMLLTFLAGLIPSSAASRRDPVEALRSE